MYLSTGKRRGSSGFIKPEFYAKDKAYKEVYAKKQQDILSQNMQIILRNS